MSKKKLEQLRNLFEKAPRYTLISFLIGCVMVLGVVIIASFASFIAPYDPNKLSDKVLLPSSNEHLMGTDRLGRDLFSRVLYGSSVSLLVAFILVAISACVGVVLGRISGYFSGKLDHVLHVLLDALYAFPYILLALTISVVLGLGILITGAAVAIAWIPLYYRTTRSITLSIKERTCIEVERALGASHGYIMLRHILPQCSSSVLVLMSLGLGRAIITASSLGFLGFGITPPTAEWGAELSLGTLALLSGSWWGTVFPGLAIFITVLGFNLFGEGLNAICNT